MSDNASHPTDLQTIVSQARAMRVQTLKRLYQNIILSIQHWQKKTKDTQELLDEEMTAC